LRVVVVTMDSHLGGAMARAAKALQTDIPGLELSMHAADEWTGDAAALAACHRDIARADVIIATMLFLDDHIRAVLPALAARRDRCGAMLCCLSAGEVVRLTRAGRLDMSKAAGGTLTLLKRLRGKSNGGSPGGSPGGSNARGQMKMLRKLPKLLRFIPGAAQDLRAYFLTLQYWLAGSEENLANMVRLLVGRYMGETDFRPVAAAPVVYPDVGLYHPRGPGRIFERVEQLPEGGRNGRVGLLIMRSYALSSNAAHYTA
jgi:magnesium chelatase subunit H